MIALFAACLAFSDGHGATTVTCPDGRSGYLYTAPGGATSGMLGGEVYQPPPLAFGPQFGNGPQAVYVPPPAGPAPAPAIPPAPPPAPLPSLFQGAAEAPDSR